MRVYNMVSPRTGREVANQFIIEGEGKVTFQSYNSMIAEIDYKNQTLTIGTAWDYSTTTGKYRNAFFNTYLPIFNTKKAIQAAQEIYDSIGEYELQTATNRFKVIFE